MDGAAIARLDRRDVAVMDAQSAQTRRRARGRDRHGFADAGDARMHGTRRYDADAVQDERTVDRQAKPAGGRRRRMGVRQSGDAGAQRRHAFVGVDAGAEDIRHRDARMSEQGADFRFHLLAASRSDFVDFGDSDGSPANAEEIEDFHVLDGLRHDAVVGGHHQQGMVHIADARQHVLDEALVARHVHEAEEPSFSSGRRSVSIPVSARTSEVLPWSTCPAVAMIMVGPGAPA